MILDLFFPVKPEPKLRARITMRGAYTPAKTLNAEAEIRLAALTLLPRGFQVLDEPLLIEMNFILKKPVSVKRLYPTGRPDLDNYIKLVSDALNGIVWKDDSQIVSITSSKYYLEKKQIEGIHLIVWGFNE